MDNVLQSIKCSLLARRLLWVLLAVVPLLAVPDAHGAMLYKNYVVRYDRGWDILCDPYEVQPGDWVLKIFRQKGEIAHEDFREFLGIFERLNPQIKDIDRIRPGQVVDIPLKKLPKGALPGQSSGVVTIPFVMLSSPPELVKKHTRVYTVQKGDTLSQLIAKRFGGRYGNSTFQQGLKLFKAANPTIKDINQIYAGQKIYMPDPSIRQQAWYDALFDKSGNLVGKMSEKAEAEAEAETPVTQGLPVGESPPQPGIPAAETNNASPATRAASVIGGHLMNKGTYFLPMKKGGDFELDLSRYPMIDLQNGTKVILTSQNKVMNVDLPLVRSYWKDVKVVKVAEDASSQEVLNAVLAALPNEPGTLNRLAFEDQGISVSVSAKWINSAASADGRELRHTCITPITSSAQGTNEDVVRFLDKNDIIIKDILNGSPVTQPKAVSQPPAVEDIRIDAGSQKAFIDAFAQLMGFHYSPNTSISFPYAGIQVKALSNLLSFGNGKELLVDFGDLYGDALSAIKDTGMNILHIDKQNGPMEIIHRLMENAGMAYTPSPVFYGAQRSAEFNTAITVKGILLPMDKGKKRLFTEARIPKLIADFIRSQGIQLVHLDKGWGEKQPG